MKMIISPTAAQIVRLSQAVAEVKAVLTEIDRDSYLDRARAIAAIEAHEAARTWGEGSLQVSAGFIMEDLAGVWIGTKNTHVTYRTTGERFGRTAMLADFNRRELREFVKFLQQKPFAGEDDETEVACAS